VVHQIKEFYLNIIETEFHVVYFMNCVIALLFTVLYERAPCYINLHTLDRARRTRAPADPGLSLRAEVSESVSFIIAYSE
jgi:hypothetical protein